MNRLFQPELLPEEDAFSGPSKASPGGDCHVWGLPVSLWQRYGVISVTAGLVLFLISTYKLSFLKANADSAAEFFFSAEFALFCGIAVILSLRKLSGFWYELSVFALAAGFLFFCYGDSLSFFKMNGDNVCQVAYWNILTHPNLAGSIGVSSAKPGQILILGLIYQLCFLGGPLVFKIWICLVMAACVWSIVAVATELGGRVAGILTFLLSIWAFEPGLLYGESVIYVVTPVFAGLRLYYYHPKWKSLGRLLLVLAIMFRIETIAVLAVVWLIHLARREWRDLAIFSALSLAALLVWVGIVSKIQGSLARINSGAAAGYLGPQLEKGQLIPSFATIDFPYIVNNVVEDFSNNYSIRFLLILSLVGIAGAFAFRRRIYLCVFAPLIIILANAFFFGGIIELRRYFPLVFAFSCAIGVASLVRYGDLVWRRRKYLELTSLIVAIMVVMAGFDYGFFHAYLDDYSNEKQFVPDAKAILASEKLPAMTRFMGEDDLLSYVVVIDPERFSAATSLQYFNISNAQKRQEILSRTDFVWIDLSGYPFYYFFYLPLSAWRLDPFRQMAHSFVQNQALQRSLYGFRFTLVELTYSHLLLKVEK